MVRAKTPRNQAMFLVQGPRLSWKKEQTNEDGPDSSPDSCRTKPLGYIQAWPHHRTVEFELQQNIQKLTWRSLGRINIFNKDAEHYQFLEDFFLFKAKEHMELEIQNEHVTSSMTGLLSTILRPIGHWMSYDSYWFTCSFPASPA